MFKLSNTRALMLAILCFSFAYRLVLMLWATYPPGADIGLHESVINSISGHGNVDFLYNAYQMGGGLSLTFPGYHIFVSYIILMTGIPDYLAHSLVVSLFSTLVVGIAFLVTRRLWGVSSAFIVAFLVAISRFDIEMLLWGGYPNVVTLALIPLVFYLYLQRERFSLFPFFSATTLLVGALFLTHSLSAVIFVSLTFILVIFVLLHRKIEMGLRQLALWVLPIFTGAVIVSPFLVQAVPAYLGANSETFTGGVADLRLATLSTRLLPAEFVTPLFLCVVFFFLFSKEYKGKFLTVSSMLLTLWIVVPMLFTQGYLVGVYTDYNRFLYFVLFPLFILIGIGINHIARLLGDVTHTYLFSARDKPQMWKELKELEARLKPRLTRKNLYSGYLLGILLFMFLLVPLVVTPWEGTTVQGFYQVMTNPGFDTIQWAKNNTPPGSVFVSDALYGWWLGGFAERPTLSAVDPQYLTLSREFAPAQVAKDLLDTDYVIDNGLIQVREDGGYISRHNPMFLAKLNWTYFPYPFFNFVNGETVIGLRNGTKTESLDLTQLPVMNMHMETTSDEASIFVSKGDDSLNYTQILTVYKGVRFVEMSVTLESSEDVSVYEIQFLLQTKGTLVDRGKTIGFLDLDAKVLGQLIFVDKQPQIHSGPEILYILDGGAKETIQLSVGVYSISDDLSIYQNPEKKANFINGLLDENLNSYQSKITDLPFDVFNYKTELIDWNISYITCRESDVLPKFFGDPSFCTIFINNNVAVFKVRNNFS